ncbi:MAG TPA: hypothetical protein VIJ88_01830 [Candidatus Paceibacterota bacterium]
MDPQEQAKNEAFLAEMERRRVVAGQITKPEDSSAPQAAPYSAASYPEVQVTETGIIGFLIKKGIVKDASHANLVLIGVFIVVVGIVIWVNWPQGSAPHASGGFTPIPGTPTSATVPTP